MIYLRRSRKLTLFIVILILTALAVAWPYRIEILNSPAKLLVRHDHPEKNADYILLMMGGVIDRAEHAAAIYKEGYAEKIIFAEAEIGQMTEEGFRLADGQASYEYLQKLGVPKDDIIFLSESRNTSSREEVEYILSYLREIDPGDKRIILVTSWYHSSRATWILKKIQQDEFSLESFPTEAPERFWAQERDFLYVYLEYLKWVYYLVKY